MYQKIKTPLRRFYFEFLRCYGIIIQTALQKTTEIKTKILQEQVLIYSDARSEPRLKRRGRKVQKFRQMEMDV